jgi:hypothetical protein
MARNIYVIVLAPELPQELLELFVDVLDRFENGVPFLTAARVEFSNPGFVMATLPEQANSKLKALWIPNSLVLSIVEAESGATGRMGFHQEVLRRG